MARNARWWPLAVTAAAAAALTGAALVTVESAGCADPGRYVQQGPSVELVGGCLEPDDLPVAPPPVDHLPQPADPAVPLRP